ncbi:MAG TPA: hypothetical protein VLI07_20635, partial [Candidatus Binatus sp.]|nr:hypothetical protein [Candidatus Binatus sp.]
MNRRQVWIALWAALFVLWTLWRLWQSEVVPAHPVPPAALAAVLLVVVPLLATGRKRQTAGLTPQSARLVSWMHWLTVLAL